MSSKSTSRPTLLIVMGVSGSGKSTVGSALSTALSCPFVDGDDLHPAWNIEKMSRGQALKDSDREPWLVKIRETGVELATCQSSRSCSASCSVSEREGVKKLAEVYETWQQTTTCADQCAAGSTCTPSAFSSNPSAVAAQEGKSGKKDVAIIACSSLKLIYRRLLRGTIKSLDDQTAIGSEAAAEVPKDLSVIHIYLDLSRDLLEERMRHRKGHFMKLDMLYSQLDTLQKPEEAKEPGVVVVKVERETTTEEIVHETVRKLRCQNVV